MLLAKGPIPKITSDWIDTDQSDPGFSDLVITELQDLPGILSTLDLLIDPDALFPDAIPDDGSDLIMSAVDDDMATVGAADFTNDLVAGDASLQTAGAGFVDALNATPAEAFQPVPKAGSFSAPPPPVPIQVSQFAIAMYNLSRQGATDFRVGDDYSFQVVSVKTQDNAITFDNLVLLVPTFNGNQLPTLTMIYDPNANNWHYEGTFGPLDVGVWSIELTVYGPPSMNLPPAVGPQVNFQVLPSTAATPPVVVRPVSAQFMIPGGAVAPDMSPYLAVLHIGDPWTLTLSGPPNVDVIINATQNGQQLPLVSLGHTDQSGNLTLQGAPTVTELGNWTETYTIGGVQWKHVFAFLVQQ